MPSNLHCKATRYEDVIVNHSQYYPQKKSMNKWLSREQFSYYYIIRLKLAVILVPLLQKDKQVRKIRILSLIDLWKEKQRQLSKRELEWIRKLWVEKSRIKQLGPHYGGYNELL